MSAPISLAGYAARPLDKERGHRLRLHFAAAAAVALLLALTVYGFDYYALGAADRPLSPKHHLLKPSGPVGIRLGMLGLGLFLLIFLYALRKRVPWLARRGSPRHWLDFHVIAGSTAPLVIAFHASFKFRGIAGMAFWMMAAVALSGIVGRYIYAQIPRSLNSAELSLQELNEIQEKLAAELAQQQALDPRDLAPLLRTPSSAEALHIPMYRAFGLMLYFDLLRPLHVARLRWRVLGGADLALSLGGLLRSSHGDLERVIDAARRKASLSKRVALLGRSQQVFHLWHVVHRPFSYSFAVLALVHIVVVMLLGYF